MRHVALMLMLVASCSTAPTGGGNTCIEAKLKEGDPMRNADTGRIGVVRHIYGPSPKCMVASHPNLADVEY